MKTEEHLGKAMKSVLIPILGPYETVFLEGSFYGKLSPSIRRAKDIAWCGVVQEVSEVVKDVVIDDLRPQMVYR